MIDWLIVWLIDWLNDWLIDWCMDWLIDWLIDCLIDWLIEWLIDWLDWLIDAWIDWLIEWLHDWLIEWLMDWLVDGLMDGLIDWLIDRLSEHILAIWIGTQSNHMTTDCSRQKKVWTPLRQQNTWMKHCRKQPKLLASWSPHMTICHRYIKIYNDTRWLTLYDMSSSLI